MTDRDRDGRLDRRGFLTLGGLGAAAVAAGGATPAAAQAEGRDEMLKARYRETPHVQAFYRTARYRKTS